MTFDPATTVAGPVLVTAMSAEGLVTNVLAVELLLPGVGSDVLLDTVAVLDSVPLAVGLTCPTNTKVAVEPAARVVHDAVEVLPPETDADGPEDWVKLTKVSADGSVSVRLALVAASGPLLVTVIV